MWGVKCRLSTMLFLLQLKLLQQFTTDNDLDLYELAFKLFRKLKYFKWISFMFKKCRVGILKNEYGNEFILSCNGKKYLLDFDRLVRTVNLYKMERPSLIPQSTYHSRKKYSAPLWCKKKLTCHKKTTKIFSWNWLNNVLSNFWYEKLTNETWFINWKQKIFDIWNVLSVLYLRLHPQRRSISSSKIFYNQ